jgi:carbon storage regulator
MLILSRRPNESLRIAGNVVITVVGFSGNQVRLGITAPPNIIVDREEVHQRKLAERVVTINAEPVTAVRSSGAPIERRRLAVRGRTPPPAE